MDESAKFEVYKKPPIGLRPKWVYETRTRAARIVEICQAIERYADASENIPIEWLNELLELQEFKSNPDG